MYVEIVTVLHRQLWSQGWQSVQCTKPDTSDVRKYIHALMQPIDGFLEGFANFDSGIKASVARDAAVAFVLAQASDSAHNHFS